MSANSVNYKQQYKPGSHYVTGDLISLSDSGGLVLCVNRCRVAPPEPDAHHFIKIGGDQQTTTSQPQSATVSGPSLPESVVTKLMTLVKNSEKSTPVSAPTFSKRGEWKPNTSYTAGDVVQHGGRPWLILSDMRGTIAPKDDSSACVALSVPNTRVPLARGAWQEGSTYQCNDIVSHDGWCYCAKHDVSSIDGAPSKTSHHWQRIGLDQDRDVDEQLRAPATAVDNEHKTMRVSIDANTAQSMITENCLCVLQPTHPYRSPPATQHAPPGGRNSRLLSPGAPGKMKVQTEEERKRIAGNQRRHERRQEVLAKKRQDITREDLLELVDIHAGKGSTTAEIEKTWEKMTSKAEKHDPPVLPHEYTRGATDMDTPSPAKLTPTQMTVSGRSLRGLELLQSGVARLSLSKDRTAFSRDDSDMSTDGVRLESDRTIIQNRSVDILAHVGHTIRFGSMRNPSTTRNTGSATTNPATAHFDVPSIFKHTTTHLGHVVARGKTTFDTPPIIPVVKNVVEAASAAGRHLTKGMIVFDETISTIRVFDGKSWCRCDGNKDETK